MKLLFQSLLTLATARPITTGPDSVVPDISNDLLNEIELGNLVPLQPSDTLGSSPIAEHVRNSQQNNILSSESFRVPDSKIEFLHPLPSAPIEEELNLAPSAPPEEEVLQHSPNLVNSSSNVPLSYNPVFDDSPQSNSATPSITVPVKLAPDVKITTTLPTVEPATTPEISTYASSPYVFPPLSSINPMNPPVQPYVQSSDYKKQTMPYVQAGSSNSDTLANGVKLSDVIEKYQDTSRRNSPYLHDPFYQRNTVPYVQTPKNQPSTSASYNSGESNFNEGDRKINAAISNYQQNPNNVGPYVKGPIYQRQNNAYVQNKRPPPSSTAAPQQN